MVEHEVAERRRRRIERHLADAKLPVGKTLDTFDFDVRVNTTREPFSFRRHPINAAGSFPRPLHDAGPPRHKAASPSPRRRPFTVDLMTQPS
jgi:hypothetical protein